MRAERDISIPSRGQAGTGAKNCSGLRSLVPGRRGPARRGEREAHNLLWRRRLKMAERMFTVLLMAGAVVLGFEAWRGGAVDMAGEAAQSGVDHMVVRAGMTVEEVRVKGQSRTPLPQIRAALDISPNQSIFAVDLDAARQKIERLSWVKSASISRQLPNGIEVNIVERAPFALWQDKGHLWLIDNEGQQLTDLDLGRFSNLPLVVGEGAPQKSAALLALLKSDPALFSRVKASVRVSNRRWDLILTNGVRVRLPDENESKAYARLASYQRESQILERDVAVVDMRFPGRLVLKLEHDMGEAGLKASDEIKPEIKGDGVVPGGVSKGNHRSGGEI